MQEGIIIGCTSNQYEIKSEGKIYNAIAKGKMKKEKIGLAVGDFVKFEVVENTSAVICEILDRKTFIKRPKISNISQIILVVSMNMPKPDLLMLDKQIAFAEFSEIKPIIVLNKVDLEDEEKIDEIKNIYEKIGYRVIKTIAKQGIGIDDVKNVLKGNVSAFSGNSGVRKIQFD